MTNFSPNMLKTYQSCPRKYYYKFIDRINVPTSFIKFEKGKKIHALANYTLKKINIARIEASLTKEENEVWQTLLNNPFFQKKCYKSEYELNYKLKDYWIGGRLDAVMFDENCYYILDYKTGSIPQTPEYDFQTMVYLLCLDARLQQNAQIAFVYIDLKKIKNHVIEFNQILKQQYQAKILETCTQITEDTIFKCNTSCCKFCEYEKLCQKTNEE